jgi:hypothetical protein
VSLKIKVSVNIINVDECILLCPKQHLAPDTTRQARAERDPQTACTTATCPLIIRFHFLCARNRKNGTGSVGPGSTVAPHRAARQQIWFRVQSAGSEFQNKDTESYYTSKNPTTLQNSFSIFSFTKRT